MTPDLKPPEFKVPRQKPFHLEIEKTWPEPSELAALDPFASLGHAGPHANPETAPAVPPFAAAKSSQKFVERNAEGKAEMLVDLMSNSQGILKQNGFPANSDSVMAGFIMNESAPNQRRLTLGRHFSGQASGLSKKLQAQGLDAQALTNDPKARAEFEKSLGEDQRFVLNRVLSSELDLNALHSKDPVQRQAAQEQLTNIGIDKRVEQYKEMESLKQAKKDQGKNFSEESAKRLGDLEAMNHTTVGFDKHDRGCNFGDMSGLSESRFREIYEEGQQRFEPRAYRQLRKDYDGKVDGHLKSGKTTSLNAKSGGPGTARLRNEDVLAMQSSGNHDLLADCTTSYGPGQIMGLYAYNRDLRAKDGNGAGVSFDLPTLMRSKDRMSPVPEDVTMITAFLNMKAREKGWDPTASLNDTGELTTTYNGAGAGTPKYKDYKSKLDTGRAIYERVKKQAGKPQAVTPQVDIQPSNPFPMCSMEADSDLQMSPLSHFED